MNKPILNMTHSTTDEIMYCYINEINKNADISLTEYQNSIRVNELRKFAEWFKRSDHYLCYGDTIDEVITEYEKERVKDV